MKIFLLEDNKTLNETVKLAFEKNGYEVYSFIDGTKALNYINDGFSCFILDVNVPNINGIKILKKIREYYLEVPVIIISSSVEFETIKNSYDFGCNDYIKKPFFIYELEKKVEYLCKINKVEIEFDEDCFFNFNEGTLTINKNKYELSPKEALLMNLFLMNKKELVSYENIQNYVWEGEYTSMDAIRTLIRRLRKKISKTYIKASTNRGYYFNC